MEVVDKRKCLVCNVVKKPLFRFPKDSTRLTSWLHVLQRQSLLRLRSGDYLHNNGRLCSEHFEEKMFVNSLRNKLSIAATPRGRKVCGSDDLPARPSTPDSTLPFSPSGEDASASTSFLPETTSPALEKSTNIIRETLPPAVQITPKTTKIRRLRSDLSKMKRRVLKMEQEKRGGLQTVKAQLNAVQYAFVKSQIDSANKDPRGRRWSAQQKGMALNIYYHSPSAYSVLRKMFSFPCKTTLKRSTQHIAKEEGICPIVLKALKDKVLKLKKDEDKWCTLVIDEMSIKSSLSYNAALDKVDGFESIPKESKDGKRQLATQALVFMLRGVFTNTKQEVIPMNKKPG